jgi:hypothetical protein
MNDTHPSIARKQIELLRAAGMDRRFELAVSMSSGVIRLSRLDIAARHPDWSEQDVKLEWVRLHYGDDLARRVRERLNRE